MNVEIGTEAAQFPEKEYINGIFFALCCIWLLNHLVPSTLYQLHFTYFTKVPVGRVIDIDECLTGTPLNHCEYEFVCMFRVLP